MRREPTDAAEKGEATARVAIVQRQARRALTMALAFAVAAAAATVVPHRTGVWLPLHLFLVGALLLAISGASRLFAVTWSAGIPANAGVVAAQRWLVAIGAGGLALGRERELPAPFLAVAGLCVTSGLVLLGGLLVAETRRSRVRRFHPALHFYVSAVAAGVVGTGLGAAMVTGRQGLRDAHVIVNLLGLVGLVIAGTLPSFTATQARMRMSRRATPPRLHATLLILGGGVAVAAVGALLQRPAVVGIALAGYVVGLGYLATTLPIPHTKQWRWAGPRLATLASGLLWWAATVAAGALRSLQGHPAFPEPLVVTLIIGGYIQILVASFAYLAPVLRGGGHERLGAGFAATRSWVALVCGNAAGLAWVLHQRAVAVMAVVVLAVDVALRTGLMLAGRRRERTATTATRTAGGPIRV